MSWEQREGGDNREGVYFAEVCPPSQVVDPIEKIHRQPGGKRPGFLGPSPLDGWLEQSAPLFRPGGK